MLSLSHPISLILSHCVILSLFHCLTLTMYLHHLSCLTLLGPVTISLIISLSFSAIIYTFFVSLSLSPSNTLNTIFSHTHFLTHIVTLSFPNSLKLSHSFSLPLSLSYSVTFSLSQKLTLSPNVFQD